GASVRVEVPVGPSTEVVAIPVSALRKGPGGDHVFLIVADSAGHNRAHVQAVRSGPVLEDEVVLLSGLTPGPHVARSGSLQSAAACRRHRSSAPCRRSAASITSNRPAAPGSAPSRCT